MGRRYRDERRWQCPRCHFGIAPNNWRVHRRACEGLIECPECLGFFPCRTRWCPRFEGTRTQHRRGQLPDRHDQYRHRGRMRIWRRWSKGTWEWCIQAAWLYGATVAHARWEECLRLALALRPEKFDGRRKEWRAP